VTIKESSEQELKSHPEITYLETEDIANATLYILGTPQNVQVNINILIYNILIYY